MAPSDLTQAFATATIADDGLAIDLDRLPTDVPAFQPGSPHAGLDSFNDQVAFELRDRAEDDHDGPARRAGRIDRFAERDELDVEAVDLEEVLGRACDAIARPDQNHIELATTGIPHQISEPRPLGLHPADPVVYSRTT